MAGRLLQFQAVGRLKRSTHRQFSENTFLEVGDCLFLLYYVYVKKYC